MKTYILSVNTLIWNLTSERHDNCAPCLGLILPIRWVTPPPNSSLRSVFLMALHLQSLHIWFGFNLNMSSWWSSLCWLYIYIYILVFCPQQHSLIAMSSCLIFFELSECDRTLTSLCFLSQIPSLQIICILLKLSNVFSASLSAEDTETNINPFSMLIPSPETRRSGNDHPAIQACVGRGTTPDMLHDGHVSFRCESPGAPV